MRLVKREAKEQREPEENEQELRAMQRRLMAAERNVDELQVELEIAKGNIDAWEAPISAWLDKRPGRRHITRQILAGALGIDEADQDHQARLRLAKIMRKLSWERTIINTEDGQRGKGWCK